MMLTQDDLKTLLELRHRSPHQLLGLHPLPDGSGLVARAWIPKAERVEVRPVRGQKNPNFTLERIPNTDIFEGQTPGASRVYPYELVITEPGGNLRSIRDPYAFLPTLG